MEITLYLVASALVLGLAILAVMIVSALPLIVTKLLAASVVLSLFLTASSRLARRLGV